MALPISGQVIAAIAAVRANGSPTAMQMQLGELGISQILPKYAAMAWSGLMYYAANTATQALSAASTTFTGLAVGNPVGSGKNLVIVDAAWGIGVAASAVATPRLGYATIVALTTGNSTGPKGASVLAGTGSSSVANVGASGSLGAAPVTLRALSGIQWVTADVVVAQIYAKDEIAGAIIIPPGQMITIDSVTGAASGVGSISWLELPI